MTRTGPAVSALHRFRSCDFTQTAQEFGSSMRQRLLKGNGVESDIFFSVDWFRS